MNVRPGDIVFGPIRGWAGAGVAAGQLSLAAIEAGPIWRTGIRDWWSVRHVLVATSATTAVQAMPSGAEEIELSCAKHWTKDYVYVRPKYELDYIRRPQGVRVALAARSFIGRPYNFATYAAIPAHRLHIPVPHLDRYIASRTEMICSQLADQALTDADWSVFDDGRLSQDVTPFELFRQLCSQPGVKVVRGG